MIVIKNRCSLCQIWLHDVIYGQPECCHCFSGQSFHQHPSLLDCLLPLVSRNYSAYVTRRAFARKIRLVHNDSRYIQVKKHGSKFEYQKLEIFLQPTVIFLDMFDQPYTNLNANSLPFVAAFPVLWLSYSPWAPRGYATFQHRFGSPKRHKGLNRLFTAAVSNSNFSLATYLWQEACLNLNF